MSNFQRYSAFYDLLYQDKDYEAEARYVVSALRELDPDVRTVLELGSGTGRHGRLMARMGLDVHGVELSEEMVAIAGQSTEDYAPGSFTCQTGDICKISLRRTFDAVISLFHVISYQTTNDALLEAFGVAARHLKPGGVFLFDVWHGPAVLIERPGARTKEASDESRSVTRKTSAELDTNASVVTVTFDIECRDLQTADANRFSEEHRMRYLFPTEINLLARATGFEVVRSEAFLTADAPSPSTWGVAYVLVKG